jgi:acetyltransferase
VKEFPHVMAARLTQIDYDRELAIVATRTDGTGGEDIIDGAARFVADPDGVAADFAIIVRTGLGGRGLGHRLLSDLLVHAGERGLKTISSEVLRGNSAMLDLANSLGFTTTDSGGETLRVWRML